MKIWSIARRLSLAAAFLCALPFLAHAGGSVAPPAPSGLLKGVGGSLASATKADLAALLGSFTGDATCNATSGAYVCKVTGINGTPYPASGMIKSVSGAPTAAVVGTDYLAPSSIPSGGLVGSSGAILPGSQIVEVESLRQASDGTDWGLAIQRAINIATANGGTVRISTPGTLQMATQVSIPQGSPYTSLVCASRATNIQEASSLTKYMFVAGPSSANGGVNIDIKSCTFSAATKSTALGFSLNNANGITFQSDTFSNFTTAINSASGYSVTLDDVIWINTTNPFISSTAAHSFVAKRNKCYNCGNVYYIGAYTYSINIEDGDYETVNTVLSSSGGAALRYVGNYLEYPANDPIYNSSAMNDVFISGNYFSYGSHNWNITNFAGGQFKDNSLYNMNVYTDPSSSNVEFGDNSLGGTAQVGTSLFQAPTLENGWTQQSGYSPVGYRRAPNGRVYLQGNLTNSTSTLGTAAFNLPAAYRPATQRTFLSGGPNNSTTYVTISSGGDVVISSATGAGTSGSPYLAGLDAISFEPYQ